MASHSHLVLRRLIEASASLSRLSVEIYLSDLYFKTKINNKLIVIVVLVMSIANGFTVHFVSYVTIFDKNCRLK